MNKKILVIISLFTLLQIIILTLFGYTPYPDSNGYLYLAKECIEYGDIYPAAKIINKYPFIWNIGSINITILSLRLFNSITPLLFIFAIIKGFTAYLFFCITRKICNIRTAFISLVIYILYPANYGECTSLLSELPFMFFIMLSLYICLVKKSCAMGGIIFSIANLFRPTAIFFIIPVIIFLFIKKDSFYNNALKLVTAFFISTIIIGSYNRARTTYFIYEATTGWPWLMFYSMNNDADSQNDCHQNEDGSYTFFNNKNFDENNKIARFVFLSWLIQHPAEYIQQIPYKIMKMYVSDNTTLCAFNKDKNINLYEKISLPKLYHDMPRWSPLQVMTVINLIYYYILIAGGIVGSIRLYKKRKYEIIGLMTGIIVINTLSIAFLGHGETRYHIPLMPFFIVITAIYAHDNIKKSCLQCK